MCVLQAAQQAAQQAGAQAEDPNPTGSSQNQGAQHDIRTKVCRELQECLYRMKFSYKTKECPKALTQALQCPPGDLYSSRCCW